MTTPEVADNVVADIRKSLNRLTKATIAGYGIAIVLALGGGYFGNATREGACALRGDVEQRVAASKRFLAQHPDAIEKLGLTKAQVVKEIANEQRTVDSLGVIPCF